MAQERQEHYDDDNVDFEAFEDFMDSESELSFEKIPTKKRLKMKKRRDVRRRLDDYFERKHLSEKDRYFDFDFDYDLDDSKYH